MSAIGFKRRVRGTAKQIGKPFPVFARTQSPFKRNARDAMRQLRPATKSRFAGVNPLMARGEKKLLLPFKDKPPVSEECIEARTELAALKSAQAIKSSKKMRQYLERPKAPTAEKFDSRRGIPTIDERMKAPSPAEAARRRKVKIMAYWRKHPGLSKAEAESEALKPIRTREIREAFGKTRDGVEKVLQRLRITKQPSRAEKLEDAEVQKQAP